MNVELQSELTDNDNSIRHFIAQLHICSKR